MVGTSSATSFLKLLFKKFNSSYVEKVENYLSLRPTKSYLDLRTFHGLTWPPNSDAIRDLYLEAERSCLTPYGYSNESRFCRELQSVKVDASDVVAFDWTHQTLKNYQLPGANALFTGNKGSTREIVSLLIVDSTKASQVAHGIVAARRKRENFRPGVVYTDTCPHNLTFWRLMFGAEVAVRLGLFHLIQRIYRTLDTHSDFFWPCLVELKAAMYSYHEQDMSNLLACLKDGSFEPSGKKYTSREIVELQHSKRWNERFAPYLRKKINSAPVVSQKVDCWISKYSSMKDSRGRSVFTRETEKVAKEQLTKVEYVCDIQQPGSETYREIKPGPRSQHGLSKWKTNRPESHLENFHEWLAHYANTGMRPELANVLCLRGTCEYNVRCRWAEHMQASTDSNYLPRYLQELPQFHDHSMLALLNLRANELDLERPFRFVTEVKPDNGERFLSYYFEEQADRNKSGVIDAEFKVCRCKSCQEYFDDNGILSTTTTNYLPPAGVDEEDSNAEEEIGGGLLLGDPIGTENSTSLLPVQWQPTQPSGWHGPPTEGIMPLGLSASISSCLFPSGALVSAPVPATSSCKACFHHFRTTQLRETVRGRPPNHDAFCPLAKTSS